MLRSDEVQLIRGGFEEAAPEPDYFKLKNARSVGPLYHGDGCVGLSGLYAVVNGLRLVVAHKHTFTQSEVDGLLRAGLRFMAGRLSPAQAVVCGLRVHLWWMLTEALAEVTLSRTGIRVWTERLFVFENGREPAFSALEQAVRNWRVPMLLCRSGHYTVVSGFTSSSLLLFDSGGACWMAKRGCGVPGDCENARHMLYPASFVSLSV